MCLEGFYSVFKKEIWDMSEPGLEDLGLGPGNIFIPGPLDVFGKPGQLLGTILDIINGNF